MAPPSARARERLHGAWRFCLQVLGNFRRNQGMLLAGAVAYYTLLSIVPLFTLLLLALSHLIDQQLLLQTLDQLLGLALPGHTGQLMQSVVVFLNDREPVGWILLGVLLFFSSLAFSALENAMMTIFHHRGRHGRRFVVSTVIPFLFILFLGIGFLVMTLVATGLQTIGTTSIELAGRQVQLDTASRLLIYLVGLAGQILMLASIYMVMPVGRLSWRKALRGGAAAGLVWEVSRHALVWYFSTLSFVNVVYGSLATVIFVLLGLEAAALILLLGAQVIAEFERRPAAAPGVP